jgi:hypothetical protein
MRDVVQDQRWMFGWAFPVSLTAHLLIAALLIFGLPVPFSQSQEEQAIEVDLVPPPKPPEEVKVEPPPPAKDPKVEEPKETSAEMPSSTARPDPSPALRPVVQFGEKDTGPRESTDGSSAEDGSPAAQPDPDNQDLAEPPAAAALNATNQILQAEAPIPTRRPADAVGVQQAVKLQKAETLFSRAMTDNPTAVTAMRNIPRDQRASQLCLTELRQQLLNASPPYFPELLPSDRPKDGTIIEIPRVAFRASGLWYNLSYRCEIDADALKVLSFAFNVGEQIPRSEWQRRGLPSQ